MSKLPPIGDTMSLMPGHRAVFRGIVAYGQPVYETEVVEMTHETTRFMELLERELDEEA